MTSQITSKKPPPPTTGKSLFANKLAKDDIDINFEGEFLDEPGDKITVDEALFDGEDLEDMEDLEISDDEDESSSGDDEDLREALFNQ